MEEKSRYDILVQRSSDFKSTFGSAIGLRALGFLSDYCLEHEQTYDRDSDRKTAFNEGARSVILEIRHWLELDITKLEKNKSVENEENE